MKKGDRLKPGLTKFHYFALFFVFIVSLAFATCKKEAIKSNKKDILSFALSDQTDTATIDKTNKQVSVMVKYNADLKKQAPKITVSDKATIDPASGDTVDFSTNPVTYTVTAEDNSTQGWKVSVTKTAEMEKKILSFVLNEQVSNAVIDDVNDSVKITVVPSADLTKLTPTITVSDGVTIDPASGTTVDFSKGPVKYTLTATDGSTQVWTVVVTRSLYAGHLITAVTIPNQVSSSHTSNSYTIVMPSGTDLTSLVPTIEVSPGAVISPVSGQSTDFSQGPVSYTVTSETGTSATWKIFVTLPLIPADDSDIHYVGRVDFSIPSKPVFANPGVYIRANFTGTFCDVDINDVWSQNYIAVVVDGQPPVRFAITSARTTYRIASGLSAGEHKLLICKETEAAVSPVTFYGLRCDGLSPVTDMPTRKIECYGNSITCGANMLSGEPCDLVNNQTNWNAANSAYLSYGAVAARGLNAEWQLTSYSGIGLVHSCCNLTFTLPDIYQRLDLGNASSQWDFSNYIPDVVTICLGQNDGTSVVASQQFKDTYITFINDLRGKYPNASIFCLTSPMADSSSSPTCLFKVMEATLTYVVDSVNNAGDSKVYWVKLPHDQNHGCTNQGHPSVEEHAITAGVLEKAIKQIMGW